MKIMICQINTTPRDFEGNFSKISKGIELAKINNSDLVVFPEATIPGYLCQDLMYSANFIKSNHQYLQKVIEASNGCKSHIVIGYYDHNTKGVGKPFANKAAVICNGCLIGTYQKRLLPFYDVFDEGRYFEPGSDLLVINIKNEKWGILICEDLWNDKDVDNYNYHSNPVNEYRKIDVNNIISINSSPYVIGKPNKRIEMLKKISKDMNTIIYVNQIGGQDELVFDGNSCIISNNHIKHIQQEKYKDTYQVAFDSYDDQQPNINDDLREILVLGLRDYINKSGFKSVVLGLSGGIDSAVVAALACEAIGPKNVNCVLMPSVYSSQGSKIDAINFTEVFGCNKIYIPINHGSLLEYINNNTNNELLPYNKVADENIQARLRGLTLMHLSNAYGWLLLTTGNKTESACGYCTLYGDMAGGFNPIKDLYKYQVYSIASQYKIPINIINKPPSAELAPGQTDEASLLPYKILDLIVKSYIEDYVNDFDVFAENNNEWCNLPNSRNDYERIIKLCDSMEFKRRQSAPGIKVSKVAFGIGRRLPIVKGPKCQ